MSEVPTEFEDDRAEGEARRVRASLNEALLAHRVPLENHDFIRGFDTAIGIIEYTGTTGYIKAKRANAGPELRIHSGYTSGFLSEAEIIATVGDVYREPSSRPGLWTVLHPVNKVRDGDSAATSAKATYGTCPACTFEFSANGLCACNA